MFIGELRLNEWAPILFGATGFVISIITLFRSVRTERRSQEIALNQKRFEVLSLTVESELALLLAKRNMQDLAYDLLLNNANDDLVKQARAYIEEYDRQLATVRTALLELKKEIPKRPLWKKLSATLGRSLILLKETSNARLAEERGRQFIDGARLNMRLVQEARTLGVSVPPDG